MAGKADSAAGPPVRASSCSVSGACTATDRSSNSALASSAGATIPFRSASVTASSVCSAAVDRVGSVMPSRKRPQARCPYRPQVGSSRSPPSRARQLAGRAGQPSAAARSRGTAITTGVAASPTPLDGSAAAASGRVAASAGHTADSGAQASGRASGAVDPSVEATVADGAATTSTSAQAGPDPRLAERPLGRDPAQHRGVVRRRDHRGRGPRSGAAGPSGHLGRQQGAGGEGGHHEHRDPGRRGRRQQPGRAAARRPARLIPRDVRVQVPAMPA